MRSASASGRGWAYASGSWSDLGPARVRAGVAPAADVTNAVPAAAEAIVADMRASNTRRAIRSFMIRSKR
ncbi:MAG TPA: hypothetical protein VEX15_07050 [Nocardioidaceae bacterium]|nr:hypothetical protein [Nocardioidaceae bacterium]